jgi:hypothetical protein
MMIGFRNLAIAIAALGTTTYLVALGISYGTDMLALATVIGAKDGAAAVAIFGRGYNKAAQNGNKPT